jgi:hypothetical protein
MSKRTDLLRFFELVDEFAESETHPALQQDVVRLEMRNQVRKNARSARE